VSADVFKCLWPPYSLIVGDPALCGTERFPLGLTIQECVDILLGIRTVDAQCGSAANDGAGDTASFPGGVVDGPFVAGGNRRNVLTNGTWNVAVPQSTSGLGFVTAICTIDLFVPVGSPAVNVCFDGSLWYPSISVNGEASAGDGMGNSGSVIWSSLTTTNPLGTPGNATIIGKNVPLSYVVNTSGTGTASFSSPTLTKDSDWDYA